MPMAKVYNDNFLPFTQKFEEETIYIEANHFITMDYEKATSFAATYFPMQLDVGGRQKPESYKKVRVEKLGDTESVKLNPLRCQGCSFIGVDKKDLDEHVTERHLHMLVDKDEYKKRATRAS